MTAPSTPNDATPLIRLNKRLAELESLCRKGEAKLANEKFVANAKPEVVQGERDRLAEYQAEASRVAEQVKVFEGLL